MVANECGSQLTRVTSSFCHLSTRSSPGKQKECSESTNLQSTTLQFPSSPKSLTSSRSGSRESYRMRTGDSTEFIRMETRVPLCMKRDPLCHDSREKLWRTVDELFSKHVLVIGRVTMYEEGRRNLRETDVSCTNISSHG